MHTAMEEGSFSLRRPNSATNTSGATRAGLTKNPDFVNSRARARRLREFFKHTGLDQERLQRMKYRRSSPDFVYP